MKDTSIKAKLISLVISSILIVSAIILIESSRTLSNTSTDITNKFEKNAYKSKEEELKSNVQIALKTVESFYEKAKNDPKNTEKYKSYALEAIGNISYGKNGYFWINNSEPKMLMHPTNEFFLNKDLSTYKDPDGVYVFNEMVKITSNNEKGGLVRYKTTKPNTEKLFQKFSYVIKFEPWDWIIGTGAYVDNIEDSIENIKSTTKDSIYNSIIINILTIVATILLLSFLVLIIAKKVIFSPLQNFQTGLLDFFSYLNGEKKRNHLFK